MDMIDIGLILAIILFSIYLAYRIKKAGWLKIKTIITWELPLFIRYIITEPFIQTFYFIKWLFFMGKKLEKPHVWGYFNIVLIVIFLIQRNRFMYTLLGILLILVFLKWIWVQGEFKQKYREKRGEYIRRDMVKKTIEEYRKEKQEGELTKELVREEAREDIKKDEKK